MNPEYYAIDIALIPEREALNFFINLNRKVSENSGDYSISLSESSCLPHISLAMCKVSASCIKDVKSRISDLSKYIPYKAIYKDYGVFETSGGDLVSGMDIEKDGKIIEIQENIINILKDFSCKGITPKCFFGESSEISDFSIDYSESYFMRQTGENFSPHITIGHGNIKDLKEIQTPENFACDQIAICHLGNNCTCAKVLESIKLI